MGDRVYSASVSVDDVTAAQALGCSLDDLDARIIEAVHTALMGVPVAYTTSVVTAVPDTARHRA